MYPLLTGFSSKKPFLASYLHTYPYVPAAVDSPKSTVVLSTLSLPDKATV